MATFSGNRENSGLSIRFLPELSQEPSFAKTFLQSQLYQSYQQSKPPRLNMSFQGAIDPASNPTMVSKINLSDLKNEKGKLERRIN
jgi:hypothetical protein